ncbi:phosphoglycerate kinase [Chloroflexota bacterium]
MNKLTVRDVDVSSKKVLVRVDFNVPLDEKTGEITDDSRIRAALPTIEYLIEQGAKVIIGTHLGRPDGKSIENMRLAVVGCRLSQILDKQVVTTRDCVGLEVEEAVNNMNSGDILLLENLRFHAEEESNDTGFARRLAGLADIYVNDAFGTSHRSHASITKITEYLPSVAGLLLDKELETLGNILKDPAHPFGAIVGGAKVSDKVTMLENIMNKVDILLVGGGMAATFLKAKSYKVGMSLIEEDRLETVAGLMEKAEANGVKLLLPVDVVVTPETKAGVKAETVPVENIPDHQSIVDIGQRTINNFCNELRGCKTVFWNGTMGIHEIPQFAQGTLEIARQLAELEAVTVIGGGSTGEAVTNMGFADRMTFISTGGGASLRLMGGQELSGVTVLLDRDK